MLEFIFNAHTTDGRYDVTKIMPSERRVLLAWVVSTVYTTLPMC